MRSLDKGVHLTALQIPYDRTLLRQHLVSSRLVRCVSSYFAKNRVATDTLYLKPTPILAALIPQTCPALPPPTETLYLHTSGYPLSSLPRQQSSDQFHTCFNLVSHFASHARRDPCCYAISSYINYDYPYLNFTIRIQSDPSFSSLRCA